MLICNTPGPELCHFSWLTGEELLSLPLEIWPGLALDLLEEDWG